ncbi:MAG: hypothetical protein MK100_00770 [Phycisphaerales bacterium]|nr:hypothetical protein [Phycisphaerales bacterium]
MNIARLSARPHTHRRLSWPLTVLLASFVVTLVGCENTRIVGPSEESWYSRSLPPAKESLHKIAEEQQ